MTATVSTSTGSGTPVSLLVSSAANVALPENTSVNLFQGTTTTITASGHTLALIGRTNADFPLYVQVDISVDGVSIYNDHAGQQIVVKQALSAGSHTITFTALALNQNCNMNAAGLMILDLGL